MSYLRLETGLHDQLVLGLCDSQTLARWGVEEAAPVLEDPLLVALRPVAAVEDDAALAVVEAGVVPPNLADFGHHPVLVATLNSVK